MTFDPAASGWQARDVSGFNDLIGPIWTKREGERRVLGLTVEPKHLNRRGHIHGGVLASMADNLLAVVAYAAVEPLPIATMQLNVHFVAPAQVGEFLEGRADVVRATKSVIFLTGRLTVGSRVVAAADGIWKILQPRAKGSDAPVGEAEPLDPKS